jgi:hypothetical protein
VQSKAYVPILFLGALGGAVIGWLVGQLAGSDARMLNGRCHLAAALV